MRVPEHRVSQFAGYGSPDVCGLGSPPNRLARELFRFDERLYEPAQTRGLPTSASMLTRAGRGRGATTAGTRRWHSGISSKAPAGRVPSCRRLWAGPRSSAERSGLEQPAPPRTDWDGLRIGDARVLEVVHPAGVAVVADRPCELVPNLNGPSCEVNWCALAEPIRLGRAARRTLAVARAGRRGCGRTLLPVTEC